MSSFFFSFNYDIVLLGIVVWVGICELAELVKHQPVQFPKFPLKVRCYSDEPASVCDLVFLTVNVLLKTKNRTVIWSSYTTPRYITKGLHLNTEIDTCTSMFTEALSNLVIHNN